MTEAFESGKVSTYLPLDALRVFDCIICSEVMFSIGPSFRAEESTF